MVNSLRIMLLDSSKHQPINLAKGSVIVMSLNMEESYKNLINFI